MIACYLFCVAFVLLGHQGFPQVSGQTTAQSICNSKGAVGLFANPDDTTCKQYAKCFMNNSVLTGSFYNCTGTTLFNASLQLCSTGYTCTATTTTTTTTTTTSTTTTTTTTTEAAETTTTTTTDEPTTTSTTTTTTPISAQSICNSKNAVGLYANPDDTSCKQYAKCFENNGSLIGSYYNCTGVTLFDPSLQLCSTDYTCSG